MSDIVRSIGLPAPGAPGMEERKGYAFAIVGRSGAGKTLLTKAFIAGVGAVPFVYDINREYGTASLPTMDAFLDDALRMRGRVILFEDATVFFGTTARHDKLIQLLVGKRHARNCILLLFHSMRQVPLYVLDTLNGIAILRTNDQDRAVEKRYANWPHVVERWRQVQHSTLERPYGFVTL